LDGSKARGPKIFSLDQRELWIEALVPAEEGFPAPDPILFQRASIDYIRGLGPKNSVIRLVSGTEIFLDVSQPQLLEKIQQAEDPVLDLKPHTLTEGKGALLTRLRDEFQREAEASKYAAFENLTIRAWIRPPNKAEFHEMEFRGQDIAWRDLSEGDSIMSGKNMRLKMKPSGCLPFDGNEFIIEGRVAEFTQMCRDAFAKGLAELDARAYSIKKGTALPPEEQKRLAAKGRAP
jgi:hypothetical protein